MSVKTNENHSSFISIIKSLINISQDHDSITTLNWTQIELNLERYFEQNNSNLVIVPNELYEQVVVPTCKQFNRLICTNLSTKWKKAFNSIILESSKFESPNKILLRNYNLCVVLCFLYRVAPEKMLKADDHFQLVDFVLDFWIRILKLEKLSLSNEKSNRNSKKNLNRVNPLFQLQHLSLIGLEHLFTSLSCVNLSISCFPKQLKQLNSCLNSRFTSNTSLEQSLCSNPSIASIQLYQLKFEFDWITQNCLNPKSIPETNQNLLKFSENHISIRNDSFGCGKEWITTRSRFPVGLKAKYYYEVILLSDGPMVFGWTTRWNNFSYDGPIGTVDQYSIGFDGASILYNGAVHKVLASPSWKIGEAVGCLIDLENHEFAFYYNEHCFRANNCMESLFIGQQQFYPSISLANCHQHCYVNFGQVGTFCYDWKNIPNVETLKNCFFLEPRVLGNEIWFIDQSVFDSFTENPMLEKLRFYTDEKQSKFDHWFEQIKQLEHLSVTIDNEVFDILAQIHESFLNSLMDQNSSENCCRIFQSILTLTIDGSKFVQIASRISNVLFRNCVSDFSLNSKFIEMLYTPIQIIIESNSNTELIQNMQRNICFIFALIFDTNFVQQKNGYIVLLEQVIRETDLFQFYQKILNLNYELYEYDLLWPLVSMRKLFQSELIGTKHKLVLIKQLENKLINIKTEYETEISNENLEKHKFCSTFQIFALIDTILNEFEKTISTQPIVSDRQDQFMTKSIQLSLNSHSVRSDDIDDSHQEIRFPLIQHPDFQYYEVTLFTEQSILIGWCTNSADDPVIKRYTYDGYRDQLLINDIPVMINNPTNRTKLNWKVGTVCGAAFDRDRLSVSFYLNGQLVCEAKVNDNSEQIQTLCASISLSTFQHVYCNFGQFEFEYLQNYIRRD